MRKGLDETRLWIPSNRHRPVGMLPSACYKTLKKRARRRLVRRRLPFPSVEVELMLMFCPLLTLSAVEIMSSGTRPTHPRIHAYTLANYSIRPRPYIVMARLHAHGPRHGRQVALCGDRQCHSRRAGWVLHCVCMGTLCACADVVQAPAAAGARCVRACVFMHVQ